MLTIRSPVHVARLCVCLWRWEPPSSISGNGNRIWQDTGCLLCSSGTFRRWIKISACQGENWVYLKQDFQTLRVISFWMISRFGKASGFWTNPKVSFIYGCRASLSARQEMRECCARNLCFTGGEKSGDETGKAKGNKAEWLWWISILAGLDSARFTGKQSFTHKITKRKKQWESG